MVPFSTRYKHLEEEDGWEKHVKSKELKYVQIHDLDGSYNNGRIHRSYDLRLQIKQGGSLLVVWGKEGL